MKTAPRFLGSLLLNKHYGFCPPACGSVCRCVDLFENIFKFFLIHFIGKKTAKPYFYIIITLNLKVTVKIYSWSSGSFFRIIISLIMIDISYLIYLVSICTANCAQVYLMLICLARNRATS